MGYTTEFEGTLYFTEELTIPQLKRLGEILGEDSRDHKEWVKYSAGDTGYIQWEITPDYKGLKWDGNEKFYHSVNAVNLIIAYMRDEFPTFGLKGQLLAQGEDIKDRWFLTINKNGVAIQEEISVNLDKIHTCPHCGEEFEEE